MYSYDDYDDEPEYDDNWCRICGCHDCVCVKRSRLMVWFAGPDVAFESEYTHPVISSLRLQEGWRGRLGRISAKIDARIWQIKYKISCRRNGYDEVPF